MNGMIRKIVGNVLVLGSLVLTFSCNEAADGFNAETGSSVGIRVSGGSSTNEDLLLPVTVSVNSSLGTPANGIQVKLNCTIFCEFFDRAPGEDETICDLSRVVAIVDDVFVFQTGNRGAYDLCVRMPAPANVGLSSYTETLTANIGVATATASVSMTQIQ
jgi:hypothetical protein